MMHLRPTLKNAVKFPAMRHAKVFRRHVADDARVVGQDVELAPFGQEPFNDLQLVHKCGVSECP